MGDQIKNYFWCLQFHKANEIYVYQPNNILVDDPDAKLIIKSVKNDIAIIHVEKKNTQTS